MSGGKSERDRPGFAQDDDPDAFGALIVELLAGGTILSGRDAQSKRRRMVCAAVARDHAAHRVG